MTRVSITAGATAGSLRRAATHYGTRGIEDLLPSKYEISHGDKVLEWTFSFDDQPVVGLDEAILRIPANARIKSATLTTILAFVGGTSIGFGLAEADGTVIDVDGIDVAVATAAIDAIGETVLCDGALVDNTAGIGTAAGQLTTAVIGTYTAGKARMKIVYEELYDRA